VIAAIEGSCHAGGLGFACAADIAFAAGTARFAAPEVRLRPGAGARSSLAGRAWAAGATRLVLEAAVIDCGGGRADRPSPPGAGRMRRRWPRRSRRRSPAVAGRRAGGIAETKALIVAALGPVATEAYGRGGAAAFARTASSEEAQEGNRSLQGEAEAKLGRLTATRSSRGHAPGFSRALGCAVSRVHECPARPTCLTEVELFRRFAGSGGVHRRNPARPGRSGIAVRPTSSRSR
jgi:hypothetical protein